ncbi:HXXEE domain-containing protein [Phenylobacterium sp.]|uniref:HXXEE domain-containing protein n=1 Tax=Phenylobacterium sp. TaxID=1871053 RepID=UPI0035B020DC
MSREEMLGFGMGAAGAWDEARGRRPLAAGLLLGAVLLHNLEEGLTYPAVRSEAAALLARLGAPLALPGAAAFQAALLAVSVAAGGLLLWAARTARADAGWWALRATAAVLLANVLAPHVPAAIALGGYAPGVLTAVAVNLPLGVWVLTRKRPRRPTAAAS